MMREAPKRRRHGRGQGGFTLIEVLISLSILALMMTIAWSTTSSSAQAKKFFEGFEQRNHEIRVALARMTEDIGSAYVSANQNDEVREPRTAFIGRDDELRFSSFAHRALWADSKESEQTMVYYYTDTDPEERTMTNLLRRESRRLSDEGWREVPGEIDVLLRDIERVELEYFDWRDQEWKSRWDTTAADGEKGRMPERVRITLTVTNDAGNEVRYTSQGRVMLQEELRFFAN